MTYNDWLKIWTDSGKLDKRGRRSRNFAMCRKGDSGPYATWNVYIASVRKNLSDREKNKIKKEQDKNELIESLKNTIAAHNLVTPQWKSEEEKRQAKIKRKQYFSDRMKHIFYGK